MSRIPIGQSQLQTVADSLRMLGNACELLAKALGDKQVPVENFMSVVESLEAIQRFINAIPVAEEPLVADQRVEELAKDSLRIAVERSQEREGFNGSGNGERRSP